jgi:hypothetical protein
MVNDPAWHGFKDRTDLIVSQIMAWLPRHVSYNRLLSVVMPGHSIEPHRDLQSPDWDCRVHVPLVSNPQSRFIVNGHDYVLTPGLAYRVNTEAEHSVTNDGATPRIHFMFDVRSHAA